MQIMNAKTQYRLNAGDLEVLLALARGGNLAATGERMGVDASTVFRSLQKIEHGLGVSLFQRDRRGYHPLELAQELVRHAEKVEMELEAARSATQSNSGAVAGVIRLTTTDTVLHGLVTPALKPLLAAHPLLSYEIHTGNELFNLTRRDADIAIRATKQPPQHLVGKKLGPIRVAVYAARNSALTDFNESVALSSPWVAPDDALPEHPSVIWRTRHFPKVVPTLRVNSILTVAELVEQGLGIGVLPLFLAESLPSLKRLSEELSECQTDLWLLTHVEARHLRRVATVYAHLAEHLALA